MWKSVSVAAIVGTIATSLPAYAQTRTQCAPRDVLTERLNAQYGEVFSGGGLQGQNAVLEVWTSDEDGSWTVLMTQSSGVSCIIASGTDWAPALASQMVRGTPS